MNAAVVAERDRGTHAVDSVRSDRLNVLLRSADGEEVDLEVLGRGDYFGETEPAAAAASAASQATRSVASMDRSLISNACRFAAGVAPLVVAAAPGNALGAGLRGKLAFAAPADYTASDRLERIPLALGLLARMSAADARR